VYPEGDWGLMAKFRSQKHIYDEIQAKEKLYEQQVSQVAWIREENQRKIREEFERQKNLYAAAKKSKEESDQKRFSAIMSTDLAGGDKQSGGHHNVRNSLISLALLCPFLLRCVKCMDSKPYSCIFDTALQWTRRTGPRAGTGGAGGSGGMYLCC
jgi:hypothetical protein